MRAWLRWESLALLATIPAFYLALLANGRAVGACLYLVASLVSGLVVLRGLSIAAPGTSRLRSLARRRVGVLLVAGLVLSALLPVGDEPRVLVVRLATALLVVLRLGESLLPGVWRHEVPKFLTLAILALVLCGAGFWWLEPRATTFGDGLWLAFTTAATVGYGDIVPSTPASKIFAVFVVLLGVSLISLVTAAVAATWVQAEEREIEKDILRDLHRQLKGIDEELKALRRDLDRVRGDS